MDGGVHIGNKVKGKHVQAILASMPALLEQDERIVGVFFLRRLRPLCDHLVVTDRRALAILRQELKRGTKAIKFGIDLARISSVKVEVSMMGAKAKLGLTDGSTQDLGTVNGADRNALIAALTVRSGHPASSPTSREHPAGALVAAPASPPSAGRTASTMNESADASAVLSKAAQIETMVIGKIGRKQLEEIERSCGPDELPRFVIAEGASGALAAFEDRCMIIKKGALTSLMAGSFGGGRVTTFMYADITGIEYNAGMVNGVLEILTPSYQGTANKDFWRGATKNPNADANNPYTLSNTLPLSKGLYELARDKIDDLRRMIVEAKRPKVVVPQPDQSAATDLASDIERLAKLRDQGVLDEDEFRAAKQAAIARHAGS